ncbi:MAG: PilZ domain-containing protein [Steroidobacteraceae bacterium]
MRIPQPHSALVVDLSVGGAQLGVGGDLGLALGARAELAIRPRMMERDFVLALPCQITAVLGAQDPEHPQIHFYGLSFDALGEHEQLVLHAYVQERMAAETDLLSQTLLLEAEEVSGLD